MTDDEAFICAIVDAPGAITLPGFRDRLVFEDVSFCYPEMTEPALRDISLEMRKGELVAFRDLVDELLVLLREDAEALGCTAEIEHARAIVARGTSADRQVACFERLVAEGASREEALKGLVDHLIKETVETVIPAGAR